MTAYTVIDRQGTVIARNLTVRDAMHTILTDDGRDYDIREGEGGAAIDGYELWTATSQNRYGGVSWKATVLFTLEPDLEKATDEIAQKVIAADWPNHPEAITDEQYDEMQAALKAEQETE